MIEENRIKTFVETKHGIGISEEQQVELVQKGFNQFIDEYMLLYTRIMDMETEEELTFAEPGYWSRFKDLFRNTDKRVYTGYQRIHGFVLKAEHVSDLDAGQIGEAFLFTGKGEDRSNLFEKLADQVSVDQTRPDHVEEVEGGEEK